MTRRRRETAVAAVLLAPFLALLTWFTLVPLARALLISFQDYTALNPSAATFVGLDNYTGVMADPAFVQAATNTAILLVATVPIQTVLAVVIAVALNSRLRAIGLFRALYFLPYITAPVAVGAIMLYMFGPSGLASTAIARIFGGPDGAWYAQQPWAFVLVVFVMVWTQTGFFAVVVLAGLQSISEEVYEAAELDGCGWWSTLLRITVPLLRPTLILVAIVGSVVALQAFEQPYVLSTTGGALPGSPNGSTSTLVMYIYTESFRYFHMGPASAAAFVTVFVIAVFAVVQGFSQRRASEVRG
jgi:multiple sugar transport system permease protein